MRRLRDGGLSPRLARFIIVGVGAALLFFALSWLLSTGGMPPFAATVVAYAIAFGVAYCAQRGWTFGGMHRHGDALPRYLTAQFGCAVMSGLVGHVAVEGFGLSSFWMSAIATGTASAASYLLSALWVFPVSRQRGG